MKIVLISPYLFRSMSVRILSAAIKQTPHTIFSIFFKELRPSNMKNPTDKEYTLFRDLIEQIKPDLIGISVRSTFFKQAKELTGIVKDVNKDIFVVWGGIHPTVAPEHSLGYADGVCLGEGVYPIVELIENLARGDRKAVEAVSNLYVRNRQNQIIKNPIHDLEDNIDNYPDQDWSEQNTFYIDRNTVFERMPCDLPVNNYYIMSSFGCPFSCNFCCNNALRMLYKGKGRYLRRRSVGRVIGELRRAKGIFPDLNVIDIVDDVFTFDKNWLTEFAQKYKDEINIPFSCYAHPSMIDKETIEILLNAGLNAVTMGIQSGSEHIRRGVFNINTYGNEDIRKAAIYLKELGVVPCYDLILDNPFEDIKYRYESLGLFLTLPRPFDLHQHSLTFFPGVELTRRAVRDGIIKDEFIECEEQKSMFRWSLELDTTRKPQDLFWDDLFFMTRYPGIPKALIKRLSRSRLFYKRPKLIHPLVLLQKFFNKFKKREISAYTFKKFFRRRYLRKKTFS